LENHEIKKLFDLNMYFVRILIRFYTYSNNFKTLTVLKYSCCRISRPF